MNTAFKIKKAIDKQIEDSRESSFRKHLGASIIGRKCSRQLWYTFRWAKEQRHSGRILRLFERGQLEEYRFIGYLESIGCQVWSEQDGKQFMVTDHNGHFGGSLDAVVQGLPGINEPCLAEFKTHNDKSFKKLFNDGVVSSKFEHFIQMQIYMYKAQLNNALYMAVNKNDDDIYIEIVAKDDRQAKYYIERAGLIISAENAPNRISRTPEWFECKWCAYSSICHRKEVAAINCRTCCFSTPVEKSKWHCCVGTGVKFRPDNPIIRTGCVKHIFLPDMVGGARLTMTDPNKQWIDLLINNKVVRHGPDHTNSKQLRGENNV